MKLLTITIWLVACSAIAFSQTHSTQINGTVYDEQGQPISYVNVYIEGSIDGDSSGEDGTFSFTTEAQGTVTLKASFIGYQIFSVKDDVKSLHNLKIVLKSDAKNLDFFNDTKFLKHWQYTLAYSYTDAQRKFMDYPQSVRPPFAMRHNASIALRYTNWSIRSIIGIRSRFASGRPYHNPNQSGFMNAETPAYNSLDASWIILPSKRVILYIGFANILNRTNVYGYVFDNKPKANGLYEGLPLTQQTDQGLYIGCFISLGKNAAYNTSNL